MTTMVHVCAHMYIHVFHILRKERKKRTFFLFELFKICLTARESELASCKLEL